ncbi:ABC transporter ATP-binding protein [Corynebacterium sp. 13CS0277]|uniref:ABC transporter ATP-binding protein n=1 Tax=Corynebacterium sp. 13CS0277 TaxID=2071994 RepID=UPI000D03D0CB|nr:ATP-binding cassette domain-containing protein [Corynebacterium sp. 13CS0277]PRQ12268.1 ABC transporter ATP-binding protein [Corynebacterium sp. 13CS0277]
MNDSSLHTPPLGVTARGYGFRHAGRKLPALRDIDLDIAPGERVLLLGPSGAGKSTLLAAMGGVLGSSPEDGEHSGELRAGRPGEVGMVLQDPEAQTIYTRVGDDVAFGCENLGMPREEIWPRVEAALEMVGLEVPLSHPTAALSGGQKQRLALAGVLAMGAGLILLDEPTANLDPAGAEEVVRSVMAAVEATGATLIVVEHRLELWAEHIDRVIVLSADGGVAVDGPTAATLERCAEELTGFGVWVPGVALPERLAAPQAAAGPVRTATTDDVLAGAVPDAVLWAEGLQCGWSPEEPTGPPRTLALPRGATTAITGPNGAGKTTLALTLAGLLAPVAGEVCVAADIADGLPPTPHAWRSRDLARRMSYVFQDPEAQFVARTVREELLATVDALAGTTGLFRRRPPRDPQIEARVDELLARLRLEHLSAANPFSLSGGQKRRLSVATALVASPQVVLLDEPTFGQDRNTFIELADLLRELNSSGVTIAAITHDPHFVTALATHRLEVTP